MPFLTSTVRNVPINSQGSPSLHRFSTPLSTRTTTVHRRIETACRQVTCGYVSRLKLSIGVTSHAYLHEGVFTRGTPPGRTLSESVGGILEMDGSDRSNGFRLIPIPCFDTRPDTEFKLRRRCTP